MLCPKCDIEAEIAKNLIVCENDDTPSAPTSVFSELHMQCRNPQCGEFGKTVEIVREKIK